jgi:peptidoglycan/LPS O-acetylase OafA/YrhL
LLLAWTVTAGTHHPSEWMTYPKAVLPVIGYVGNWFKDKIGVLAHTWSLALEEQYYIVWPTVLIVALRRGLTLRKIAGVLLGVTFGLAVFQATWGSVFRPHLSPLVWSGLMTYGRFGGLLLGSIVALVPEKLRWTRDRRVAYASGICVVALVFGHFSSSIYERIGIVLFALMAAIVIAHVVHAPGSPVARALSAWPLGVVGKISYGLYLYHYPLFWFISKHFSHTVVVVVLAWISAFACAIVSYAFVERRVLRAKARVGRRRAARIPRATVPVESPIATS